MAASLLDSLGHLQVGGFFRVGAVFGLGPRRSRVATRRRRPTVASRSGFLRSLACIGPWPGGAVIVTGAGIVTIHASVTATRSFGSLRFTWSPARNGEGRERGTDGPRQEKAVAK
jgi:hypothetical protein